MNSTNTELPHINQNTIECDLREFTRWLNLLADQVNYLTSVYDALKTQVDENTEDIRLLKQRMTNAETRISNLETRMTNLENRVNAIEQGGWAELIAMVNGRVDLLYGWLPVPYGTIDSRGWKFAMGNISVMSTQTSPANVDGPGIYTSGSVKDNDVTFN